MAETIWKSDVAKKLGYKSKVLPSFDPPEFALTLNDKVLDVLEKADGGNRQAMFMVEDAQKLETEYVGRLKSDLETLDKQYPLSKKEEERKKLIEAFTQEMEKDQNDLAKKLKEVPAKRWVAWEKTKKEYKDYKIETGLNITKGVLGAIGSGLAIAAAVPTGGATLALGIVGGVRSGLSLFQSIGKAWVEAETVEKKMVVNLKVMEKIYVDKSSAQKSTVSGISTVLNSVLNIELLPSVKTIESDCTLWDNKLKGLDVNASKAGDVALKALKDIDLLEKLLSDEKLKKNPKVTKINDKLKDLRKEVSKQLDKCHKMSERMRNGKPKQQAAAKVVEELKTSQPKFSIVFDKLVPLLINGGLAIAGAGDGFASAKDALEYANTSLQLANDILELVKSAIED